MIESKLSPALLQAISETVTWCAYRQLSDIPFRSLELDPSAILVVPEFPQDRESIKTWIEKKRDCYRRATTWINQTRSELLKAVSLETFDAVDALSRSKLLIYEPLETVDDGAEDVASIGFFDLHVLHLGILGFCMQIAQCSTVFPSLRSLVRRMV